MRLSNLDLAIVSVICLSSLVIGLLTAKRASGSSSDYFLAGRRMPWWLLGASMVATTFSTDTPNLVTDIVRRHGVSGNWVWWSFLLSGMLTVFVFAAMWRRLGVMTDVEFYELRYSGKAAAFLRGFRALYLGLFFNVMIMATVTLAAIKIAGVMLGLSPAWVVAIGAGTTLLFTVAGGLRGVLWTDLALFALAMVGSIAAAMHVVGRPEVGGLEALLSHPSVAPALPMVPPWKLPDGAWNWDVLLPVFLIPVFVQWWSIYYPSAEPGGGGYVVQRLLAAKDERHAVLSTLLFNVAHYALRPWPWILVALASMVVYPSLGDLAAAFPEIDPKTIGHDLAYPAMLTNLPSGLRGLVVASLLAAYMSTISTQLNLGTSYVVHDVWKRFVRKDASERDLVRVARLSSVFLLVISSGVALLLKNALDSFQILLQVGAGTGLIFLLRWFWWRVNAAAEIVAMVVSLGVAIAVQQGAFGDITDWQAFLLSVGITTVAWIAAAFLTTATEPGVLAEFVRRSGVGGPGWKKVTAVSTLSPGPSGLRFGGTPGRALTAVGLGVVAVYAALFGTGEWLYGNGISAGILFAVATLAAIWLRRCFTGLLPRA